MKQQFEFQPLQVRPITVGVRPVLRTNTRQPVLQEPKKMSSSRAKSPSQTIPRNNRSIPTLDENGHPQQQQPSMPLCFSYRTMEKQYEEDTQRMLERIQKSRSFELHSKRTHYQQEQQHLPQQQQQQVTPRAVSMKELSAIVDEATRVVHCANSDFYIGDEEEEEEGNAMQTHYDYDFEYDRLHQPEQPPETEEEEEEEIFDFEF